MENLVASSPAAPRRPTVGALPSRIVTGRGYAGVHRCRPPPLMLPKAHRTTGHRVTHAPVRRSHSVAHAVRSGREDNAETPPYDAQIRRRGCASTPGMGTLSRADTAELNCRPGDEKFRLDSDPRRRYRTDQPIRSPGPAAGSATSTGRRPPHLTAAPDATERIRQRANQALVKLERAGPRTGAGTPRRYGGQCQARSVRRNGACQSE